MKLVIFFLGTIFLAACATEKSFHINKDDPQYIWLVKVQQKIDPIWADRIKAEMSALREKGYRIAKTDKPSRVKLLVNVNSVGEVQDISILESSHIELLDHTAMDAFKSNSPLPAPPQDLVKNGVAAIRYDFVLNL